MEGGRVWEVEGRLWQVLRCKLKESEYQSVDEWWRVDVMEGKLVGEYVADDEAV